MSRGRIADLMDAQGDLTAVERFHIQFIRKSMQQPALDTTVRWLQRNVGARWIDVCTRNLRHVHGLDRLPAWDMNKSFLLVSNHRSFFDLYVVTAELVRRGLPHRIFFPVRSSFFYDKPLGFFVNGAMSFFAMYPPVFRDKERRALNLASIDEVVKLLHRGGTFVGLHPEGTRKKDDDPYTFLPAQSGVGRIIQRAGVPVIPVFINGLINSLPAQIAGNATGKGLPIQVVFGAPIDFGGLLQGADVPRVHKAISEKALAEIGKLGDEERDLRRKFAS
jgi:1-acyl-sn-glycerol-3-phosphate acyltransferase